MTPLVPITLFGWIPVVLVLFATQPARRAVIIAFLGAWLFLPEYNEYHIQGLPAYTKISATCVGIFLSAFIFDFKTVSQFRPRWFDLPMVAWCVTPLPSCVLAGIGAYEGVSGIVNETVAWGLPYVIGRIYLKDLVSLRELAIGIFFGGLVYVPLVLLEVRMSPQLHTWVYGFHQHDFVQAKRGDGWRPTVFMQHGLAVATFMGAAMVCGFSLWLTKSLRVVRGVPVIALVIVLGVTLALCKSVGAVALMSIGLLAICTARWFKTPVFVYVVVAIPILYMLSRTVGGWRAKELEELIAVLLPDKVSSLHTRLISENAIWRGVQGDLWFGGARFRWGDELSEENTRIIPDGFWVIAMARRGVVGLLSMTLMTLLPAMLFVKRWPAAYWAHPLVGPASALAVLVSLYMADNLSNAMMNPIYLLAAGGLPGAAEQASVVLAHARRAAAISVGSVAQNRASVSPRGV